MSRTVPPRNRPPDGRGGHNPTSQETETSREIIVTNLPRSCSEDLLMNYFESRRNFGDNMFVKGVTFDGEKTQAIVEFASPNGVDVVLSRQPCKLEGEVLHIEEYKKTTAPPAPPESHGDYSDFYEVAVKSGPGDTATIEVGNYSDSTSDDALRYYFENEKRSGGGDTTDVTFDRKQNVAQVTFKDKRAVARVLKKSHVIDGQTLTVKPYITSDTDVLLKDLPDSLTEENLNNFIEAKFKNTVAHITFNEERSKAIVSFDKPAAVPIPHIPAHTKKVSTSSSEDFRLITDACRKYGIDGSHIVAARVPISNCVIVTNLPELQTKDSYRFYFELPKHGGGDVDKVDLHDSDGYCLVYFHDIKVVESVCKKNHTIADTHMHVKPYQTCLGIPALSGTAKFTFPSTESLSHIDGYKKKFLERNETQRKTLDEKLASCHGEVVWDANPVEIECTLTTKDKGYRELSKAWKSKVTETFQQFINILDVKRHTVTEATWEHVMDGMGSVDISHPDGMAVFVEKDKFTIILVGHIGIVQKNWPLIESAIKKAEREVKELKTVIDEQKELKVWQVRYLYAVRFIEEIKIEFAKVKVTLDQNKCRISFKGPKSDVSSAQVQMYQKLQEVKSSKVNIGKECVQLLQNKTTAARISDQMREHNLGDVWEVKYGDLIVFGDTDADLSKMKNVVMKVLIKTTIGLDSKTKEILDSSKWNKKKFELEKKHSECVVFNLNTNNNCLEIFTIDTVKNEIVSELQGFLSKNAVYTEQMTVDPCVAVFITRIFGDEIKRLVESSSKKGENVHITFTHGGTVNIEGSQDGLTRGKGIVSQLEGKVKKKQHTIKQPNIQAYLATEQWKDCKQNLEKTIPCVMDVMGSGLGRSIGGQGQRRNKQPFTKATPCAEATLQGVKVTVIGGDMLSLDVDVIVNAANKEMNHVGGLAAVIIKKGGDAIQDECYAHIKNNGKMSDGEVFMSSPGSMKVKAIAHAVGPVWNGGKQGSGAPMLNNPNTPGGLDQKPVRAVNYSPSEHGEQQALQMAIKTCLAETEKSHYRSIAFPALSCGMFRYPVDRACLAIVEAIDQHVGGRSSIKDVFLCDINENTVNAFVQALKQVSRHVKVLVQLGQGDTPRPVWLDPASPAGKSSSTPSRDHSFGNTAVVLKKGELAKETTDVIVNSVSHDLDLQKGASSKALSNTAGRRLQEECSAKFPRGIETGDVAVTGGGHLKCNKVFHVAIDPWKSGSGAIQGLCQTVAKCLETAHQQGFHSISFPAMGTGAQRYPKGMVAAEMFGCISGFCKKNPRTSIQTVNLVIYPADDETWEAFKTEENKWSDQDSHQSPAHHHRGSSTATDQDSHQSPTHHHHGSSKAAPGLGKLVKTSRGYAEFKVGPIQLCVSQGDITDQDSDAIVASCNRDLDLSKGAVTKAIVKKGGTEIEQDCKTQKAAMKQDGIAVTTAGQLKSKYIIHVDTKYKVWEWKSVIGNCLKKAEELKMTSLSFPALGTSVGCKPQDVAGVMFSAMADFLQGSVNHLAIIHVVIFKNEMIQPFIDGMKSAIDGKGPSSTAEGHDRHHRGSENTRDHFSASDTALDSCTMTIYAENMGHINNAVKRMEKIIDEQWHTKTVKDDAIFRLNQRQMESIKKEAMNNHCQVTIDQDTSIITIRGLVTNVMAVNDKVHAILRNQDKSTYEKKIAQQMKSIVRWYYLKGQKQLPFPDRDNLTVETAYTEKRKTVRIKDKSGGEYEIDFTNMVEVEVANTANKFPVIRRDLIADVSSAIPKTWQTMKDKENLMIVTLVSGSPEYQKVMADFTNTLGRQPNIVKIEKIQNRTLYTQYDAKRTQITQTNTRKDNERVLWHGTASDVVQSINTHGFNRSYCGKNGTAYGNGVYFAVPASYSDGYAAQDKSGHKRMYRCLVLTGDFCKGAGGMIMPTAKSSSQPHILYDSVTNNPGSPLMFIVFHDTQAYPEHLITYT